MLSLSPFADLQMPGLLSLASPGHEHEKGYGTGIQKHPRVVNKQRTGLWGMSEQMLNHLLTPGGARVTVPPILDHRPGEKRLSHINGVEVTVYQV